MTALGFYYVDISHILKGREGMKTYHIDGTDLEVSAIALGCMRIDQMSVEALTQLVQGALELGINFFDHADIYGGGASEKVFGEMLHLHPQLRDKIILQTKCGIRKGFYDFTKAHILASVEQSLKNLQTDHIDVLMLHRPDTLMDPKEVAEAFDILHAEGKVRYFAVSNMKPGQIALLQKHTRHRLLFNQVQFNVVHAHIIDSGIFVNMREAQSLDHDGGLLEYCRLHEVKLQCWSILQASWDEGCYLDHPTYKTLNDKLAALGKKYGVSKAAISVAWILRHPAEMQAIAGTTSVKNLKDLCKGVNITLTREEWYGLYVAVGKELP